MSSCVLIVSLRVNQFNLCFKILGGIIREAGIIFQGGRKERAYFSKIQILRCRLIFQEIILRYRQILISCGNFPRTNQATNTELSITTRKNAFETAEVLKTLEIQ